MRAVVFEHFQVRPQDARPTKSAVSSCFLVQLGLYIAARVTTAEVCFRKVYGFDVPRKLVETEEWFCDS
jgi:hypothetical protein